MNLFIFVQGTIVGKPSRKNMIIKFLFVLLAMLLVSCSQANYPHRPVIETSTFFPTSSSVGSTLTVTLQPTSTARKSTPTPILSATSTALPTQTNTAVPVVPPPPGIVFRTDNGIWIANEYGDKQLPVTIPTDADSMKFCSTGKYILAERETTGGRSYSTIDVSTGKQVELEPGNNRTFCYASWWPDRCDTLFAYIEPSADIGRDCESYPVIFDLNSNYIFSGFSPQFVNLAQPSSDGKLLAFTQNGKPWLYEWGVGSRPIPVDNEVFPGGDFRFYRPTWSPDNKQIAWLVSGSYGDKWMEGIGITDIETNASRFLYPNISWIGEFPSYLDWNPQLNYIALLPSEEPLRVLNPDGTPQFEVDKVLQYSWSPDGKWLMYLVFRDYGLYDVYISSADGSDNYLIGPSTNSRSWNWSPDSKYFVYRYNTNYMIVRISDWKPAILNLAEDAEIVDWINP